MFQFMNIGENKIIAKITSNCAANYQHFHELKIFSKNETIMNNLQRKDCLL